MRFSMTHEDRDNAFHAFRNTYSVFNYTRFDIDQDRYALKLSFCFDIDGIIHFNPSLIFPRAAEGWKLDRASPLTSKIAFCIGMVEAISYWKAYCPAQLSVSAGSLCPAEISWWKKLYYFGLGEFFYTNRIATDDECFLKITVQDSARTTPVSSHRSGRNLIPVGGGKDSLVSLELLRPAQRDSDVLLLNAPRAARDCAILAGYTAGHIIEVDRNLDPRLLELNNRKDDSRALNGHTPFSALLAFVSLFAATMNGSQFIVLSNESSANEATVHDSHVNHQYSKSFAFERDFREYVIDYITPDICYFSLLRPINELQIAALMSAHPRYFSAFRSCNAGSREGKWCGKCAKCLFAFLMLQPFLPLSTMTQIFGRDLLDDAEQERHLKELLGLAATKPFDCVGTVDEVRAAVSLILSRPKESSAPRRLLEAVKAMHARVLIAPEAAGAALREWNPEHYLPPEFERRLRQSSLFQP